MKKCKNLGCNLGPRMIGSADLVLGGGGSGRHQEGMDVFQPIFDL